MANTNLMYVLLVIDRSASMFSRAAQTIQGYNAYIGQLCAADDGKERRVTTMLFSTPGTEQILHRAVPVKQVPSLSLAVYQCGGMTALMDAVGRMIDESGREFSQMPEDQKPGLVQLVVMTDGYENQSVEYTREQVREKIVHQQECWGWDVVYIGQHADAWGQAQSMGFHRECVAQVQASGSGVLAAYSGLVSRNMSFAADPASAGSLSLEAAIREVDSSVVEWAADE